MCEKREELKAAAARVQQIADEITENQAAILRARTIVAEADRDLARNNGLDEAISTWRVHALKSGDDPRQLPPELAERRSAKAAAQEELNLARATEQTIERELQVLNARLSVAKAKQQRAAMMVLLSHCDVIADQLVELNNRASEKRLLIKAIRGVAITDENGQMVRFGNSTRMEVALQGAREGKEYPAAGTGVDPTEDTAARWRRRFFSLLQDPDAKIDDIRPVLPEDYSFTNEPTKFENGRWSGPRLVIAEG